MCFFDFSTICGSSEIKPSFQVLVHDTIPGKWPLAEITNLTISFSTASLAKDYFEATVGLLSARRLKLGEYFYDRLTPQPRILRVVSTTLGCPTGWCYKRHWELQDIEDPKALTRVGAFSAVRIRLT